MKEQALLVVPAGMEKLVITTVNRETGRRQIARVSCAAYGRETGLKGKELNREYDKFKDQFNTAFRASAHRLIDTRNGAKITETGTGQMTITLERPKVTADSIKLKLAALQAQLAELEAGKTPEVEVTEVVTQ